MDSRRNRHRILTRASALIASVVLGASVHALQQRPVRDQPAPPLTGTALVSGTIVSDDATAQLIARAQILIAGTDTGYLKIAETDERGQFSLANLPAGRYLLGAAKAGYIDAAYGATRPGRPGTEINLADGEHLTTIVLKMTLGGVATGLITDERGQPMSGATVQLQSTSPKSSSSSSLFANIMSGARGLGSTSDDRGIYRLFGVAPGDYVVMVTPPANPAGDARALSTDDIQAGLQSLHDPNRRAAGRAAGTAAPASTVVAGTGAGRAVGSGSMDFSDQISQFMPTMPGSPGGDPTVGYAPVYFPGTTEAAEAATVTIRAGEERAGLDVRAQLVSTARLDCQVIGSGGQPVPNVVISIAQSRRTTATLADIFSTMRFMPRPGPEGRYTFAGLPPGKYTVTARTSNPSRNASPTGDASSTPAAPPPMWATADVAISGQDVSGVVLTMQPGLTISGHVVFHSEKPVDPSTLQLNVGLRPPEMDSAATLMMGNMNGASTVRPDLSFTIDGVVPGAYMLTGALVPSGVMTEGMSGLFLWSVESATIGGKDALDLPFVVPPAGDIKDAVLTFTDRKQEVFGVLQDATGRPAPGYTVVLFAKDKHYWLPGSRRIATARPATDGRFEIGGTSLSLLAGVASGLPAGEYYLAAVTDLGPDEQYDRKLLEALVKAAVPITLAPGERHQQDLRIAGGG